MLQLTSCILIFLSCLSHCLLNSHVSNFTSIDLIRNPSSTKFPQCNFPLRVTGYPTRSAFFTRREKLHVNWFDQRSLFHKLSSMPFSTEGDSVSYTFYIFHERKTSCQLIWLEIPFPRTFLNVIFHRGWKGVLHILHFPQGEKIFISIDLIKDPSSTNFPPCNFPPRVSYTFCIFHIERKY